MKHRLILLAAWLMVLKLSGQSSSAEIRQQLQKLSTTASVLYIAAHPDDENTRLLSYLSRSLHFRTAYLSLTRGDGGQNLIGPETEEDLGLIRTQELLAARKVDGAEQYFSRAFDFGYSKNPEETFRIWNRDSILSDMVWVIRRFRPDVILTRFPTTGEGGHGHHTASAMLAVEAFEASADPKRFAWQLRFAPVWKAKRLMWNNFMPSRNAATSTQGMLKMDVGAYNGNLGLSMGEIASMSRSMHKSQGFGVKMQRGEIMEYFTHLAGDSAQTTFMDGIATSWQRFPAFARIDNQMGDIIRQFDPDNVAASIPLLVQVYTDLLQVPDTFLRNHKIRLLEDILLNMAGIYQDFTAPTFEYAPGDTLTANFTFIYRRGNMVALSDLRLPGVAEPLKLGQKFNRNQQIERRIKLRIPVNTPVSNPYWLEKAHGEGRFEHPDRLITGKPEGEARFYTESEVLVNGIAIKRKLPLTYKWVDPVKGELIRAVEVIPPIRGRAPQKVLQTDGKSPLELRFFVDLLRDSLKGKLRLNLDENSGFRVSPAEIDLSTLKGKSHQLVFSLQMPPSRVDRKASCSQAILEFMPEGNSVRQPIQETFRIQYDHIPVQTRHSPLSIKICYAPIERGVERIGYVEGAGDEVAEALAGAGYKVDVLDDDRIRALDPAQTPAVVVGIRALNSREEMAQWMPLLLDYTQKGGTLIVQYNTRNWISDVKVTPGPFPFEISRNRVTDETATVKIVDPQHPLFNHPNRINEFDFEGWVQERGLYFCEKADSSYADLLRMADPGELELSGALLYAPYGEGHFVYTGLSFFRQLPAGVPGAFRLFANLLSVGTYERP
jgi:LmbE family N-acetylglucosaminyl deacetylase